MTKNARFLMILAAAGAAYYWWQKRALAARIAAPPLLSQLTAAQLASVAKANADAASVGLTF